jgi:hypothetical protein
LAAFSRINNVVNPFTALALEKINNVSENAAQYDEGCAVIQWQGNNNSILSFFPQNLLFNRICLEV